MFHAGSAVIKNNKLFHKFLLQTEISNEPKISDCDSNREVISNCEAHVFGGKIELIEIPILSTNFHNSQI